MLTIRAALAAAVALVCAAPALAQPRSTFDGIAPTVQDGPLAGLPYRVLDPERPYQALFENFDARLAELGDPFTAPNDFTRSGCTPTRRGTTANGVLKMNHAAPFNQTLAEAEHNSNLTIEPGSAASTGVNIVCEHPRYGTGDPTASVAQTRGYFEMFDWNPSYVGNRKIRWATGLLLEVAATPWDGAVAVCLTAADTSLMTLTTGALDTWANDGGYCAHISRAGVLSANQRVSTTTTAASETIDLNALGAFTGDRVQYLSIGFELFMDPCEAAGGATCDPGQDGIKTNGTGTVQWWVRLNHRGSWRKLGLPITGAIPTTDISYRPRIEVLNGATDNVVVYWDWVAGGGQSVYQCAAPYTNCR